MTTGSGSGYVYRALARWARLAPDRPCIIEAESGRTLSYCQFLSAVHEMRTFLGSEPQNLVLALPGGIVSAVLWISALSGGHTLIPLSPDATYEEKARVGRKYRPDVVIVEHSDDAQGFDHPRAVVVTYDLCERLLTSVPLERKDSQAPLEGSVCLSTSGTTGEPKGVLLTERRIAWTADHIRSSHRLTPKDRGLAVLPFFHVNAPVVSLCASLIAGSTIVVARKFSRRQFWSWIERYQITWASIVPTILAMLLSTEKPDFLPGALRFVRTASSALPVADLHAFEARFGIPVIETYGLSEAASQVVANPVPPGQHKAGSAGLPVGVLLRVCYPRTDQGERTLRDVEPGAVGEVCVSGPSVISAYQDEAGKEAFQDGWFRTGDLGYQDEDGYVFLTGRLREMIKRGGENIAPREIEEVLLTHEAVQEAAVVGRPDALYGEQVVAYIVARSGWNAEVAEQVRRHAARKLSSYKVPIDIIRLDALPRNHTGKIERHVLRAREHALYKGKRSSEVHVVVGTAQPEISRYIGPTER